MIGLMLPIFPEIVLFFGGCAILLLSASRRLTHYIFRMAVLILLSSLLLIMMNSDIKGLFYHDLFLLSPFVYLIKVALIFFALFQFITSYQFMDKYSLDKAEHAVMVIFMLVGLNLMISSNHLILLYVGMEIQMLSAYTLTIMQRKSLPSTEAGVKYFILGSLASVIYLLGTSYIYGAFGTLYIHQIVTAVFVPSIKLGVVGFLLIISTFLFKLGVFPFHQWIPDVYQGAPAPSTSIFATFSKIAGVAVLLQLSIPFLNHVFNNVNLEPLFLLSSAVSMVIGACVPILQTHIKRWVGYSAIGHAGFMVIGLLGRSTEGIAAVIVYAFIYGFTLMMTFVCLMSLKQKDRSEEGQNDMSLAELEGLAQIRPKHSFVLAVCFLSMAGLPPLIGFFPKLLIIQHALKVDALFIVCVSIMASVISLFYYLKLVQLMYINGTPKQTLNLSLRGNKLLLMVFLPALFIQVLGGYVPLLQRLYQQHVIKGAEFLCVGFNEKNNI